MASREELDSALKMLEEIAARKAIKPVDLSRITKAPRKSDYYAFQGSTSGWSWGDEPSGYATGVFTIPLDAPKAEEEAVGEFNEWGEIAP